MANSEEQQRKMGQIIARTWLDEAFKARLKKNPVAVLNEVGYELPPGLEIEVVETTAKKAYLVLPPRPSGEVSDEDLEQIAGGIPPAQIGYADPFGDVLIGGVKPFAPRRRD